jgi:hypothetical protein
LAIRPPKSFAGSLPPFTVAEKRAARQRAIDMLLPIKESYELLAKYGCFAREICDKCGIVLGAVRFTRHGESEVYCARECRGDAQRSATHRGDGKSQRFSARFSSLEGLLVYRGELTLKSPVAHRSAARRPAARANTKQTVNAGPQRRDSSRPIGSHPNVEKTVHIRPETKNLQTQKGLLSYLGTPRPGEPLISSQRA